MDDLSDLLRYEIKNVKPVSTESYAAALASVSEEFEQYLSLHISRAEIPAYRMHMASVRAGSIISELAPYLAGTIPLLEAAKNVKDYATYLSTVIQWLLGKADRPAIADEKKTLKNIANIVRPTVHDNGAQMNIGVVSGNTFNINVSLGELQARTVLGAAKARLESTAETAAGVLHEGVVFYWDQANRKPDAKSGDKGCVDDLAKHPVKVRFADESLKQQMALDLENPFRKAYLVDLYAQTAHAGRIVLYTISRLIDIIDLETEK